MSDAFEIIDGETNLGKRNRAVASSLGDYNNRKRSIFSIYFSIKIFKAYAYPILQAKMAIFEKNKEKITSHCKKRILVPDRGGGEI